MEKLNRKTQILILLSFFIVLTVILVILYPVLPARIPMQYSFTGSVNRYADKWIVVLGAVGINGTLSLYNIFLFKDKIPAKNFIVSIFVYLVSVIAIGASLFIQ